MTKLERMKEILKASPDFGKRVGYKMCVVDELHDIKELEKENAELKNQLSFLDIRVTEAKELIENLLYYVKQCTCERSNYAEIEKDIKEAEQFIKDSEVEK